MATKDFVDYSPASGSNNGSIDITASKNTEVNPRNTTIVVKGGGEDYLKLLLLIKMQHCSL